MALVMMSGALNTMLIELTQAAPMDAAAGLFHGVKVGLYTNDAVIDENTVLADLTAPTTTGLSLSGAITWGGAYTDAHGDATVSSNLVPFISSGSVTGETIKGCYLVAGSGSPTVPLGVAAFDEDVLIAHSGDGFNLAINFKMSADGFGDVTVVD